VGRGGRPQHVEALFGEHGEHTAAVARAFLAAYELRTLQPRDLVRHPALRRGHVQRELRHPHPHVRLLREPHQDLVVGQGEVVLLLQLAVEPVLEQRAADDVAAPGAHLVGGQPPNVLVLSRRHSIRLSADRRHRVALVSTVALVQDDFTRQTARRQP
jgi:hypothetical protein